VRIAASCGFLATVALACCAANVASAEPLPGRFEATGGAHILVLGKDRCEADGDVVGCRGPWIFTGFELAAHTQVGPWLALGFRAAGSKDLDGSESFDSSDGSTTDRDTWLWRGSVEARFDPPIWPRGLWLSAEIGAALAVATAERLGPRDQVLAESSTSVVGFLGGAALGWDFSLYDGLILGFEARVQILTVEKLGTPRTVTGREPLGSFPYVSVGVHSGYRW
jgi:hypothetical protein